MNPWEQIKQQLEAALSAESYGSWVSQTSFGCLDGGILRVFVPSAENEAWMETEYANHVNIIIRKLNLPVHAVLYEPAGAARDHTSAMDRETEYESPANQLNPRFTFESFVVGACNQ